MESFYNKGRIYVVDYDPQESMEWWYLRGYFVTKSNPKNEDEFIEAVRLSRVYRNMECLGCKYPDKLVAKIRSVLEK
jgi:hypothetical protein